MDFDLSADHRMLSDTLRRFFTDNHSVERRNAHAFADPWHEPDLWSELAGLGVIGAFFTEDQGGFGGSVEDVAVVFEEIGRALCAEPLLGTLLGGRLLAAAGRTDLLDAVIAGETRCALAVFEPEVPNDLAHLNTTALRDGTQWRLTGRKTAVYGAPGAEHLLVAARTGAGTGLFLLEAPDLRSGPMFDGGGMADLVLDGHPAECLAEDMTAAIGDTLDLGRIALCAEAVGAMTWLIDTTIDYMKQRRQFGRAIADFQALRHRVVDMVGRREQARSITLSAVAHYGHPGQARHTAMAKNLVGRAAITVAEAAIQLHGGIGMTWEYAGAHYAKRLVMIDHQLGDRQDHALALITAFRT